MDWLEFLRRSSGSYHRPAILTGENDTRFRHALVDKVSKPVLTM